MAPLGIAAAKGRSKIVELLLKHPKIDVNFQDNAGLCPLWIAASKGRSKIVGLLLKHPKINVNLQDNEGVSPLDFIYRILSKVEDTKKWDKYYDIWALLVSRGAKLFRCKEMGLNPPKRPTNVVKKIKNINLKQASLKTTKNAPELTSPSPIEVIKKFGNFLKNPFSEKASNTNDQDDQKEN